MGLVSVGCLRYGNGTDPSVLWLSLGAVTVMPVANTCAKRGRRAREEMSASSRCAAACVPHVGCVGEVNGPGG